MPFAFVDVLERTAKKRRKVPKHNHPLLPFLELLWSLFLWPVIFRFVPFFFLSFPMWIIIVFFIAYLFFWRWRKRGWVDCGERRSSLSEMKSQSEEKIVFRTVTTDTRGQMHLCLVERERYYLFSLFTTSRSVADVFHSISSILYFCHTLRLLVRPCSNRTVNTLVVSLSLAALLATV